MNNKIISLIKKYYETIFISTILVCCFASITFIPLKLTSLSSLFHKISYITIFAVFFLDLILDIVFKKFEYFKDKKNLFYLEFSFAIICFSIIALSIDCLVNKPTSLSLSYLTKPLLFFGVIIFVLLCIKCRFTKFVRILLKFLTLFLSCLLILLFVLGPGRVSIGNKFWSYLTLNFSNPNTAAQVMTVLVALLIYFFFTHKKIIWKVIFGALALGLTILIIFTSCRSALIGLAAVLIFALLYLIIKKSITLSSIVICLPGIIMVSYFIIFAIYTKGTFYLPETPIAKGIGSRFTIWFNGLNLINFNPFSGNYNAAIRKTGTFQYHNCFLDIAVSYGLFVLILVIIYFCCILNDYLTNSKSNIKNKMFGIGIFACVFALGSFESMSFYSSNGLSLIALSVILLIKIPDRDNIFVENGISLNKKCDVLMINNVYGCGSTGKIVQDLHLEYLNKKINSYVIYGRNENENLHDRNVVCVESLFEVRLCQLINRIFKTQSFGYWYMTYKIIQAIKYLDPNVVHIHSLNDNFVNYKILLSYLVKHDIKTVYTNHSEYMFLGNCGGHSFDCNNFISKKCTECPKGNKYNKYIANKIFLSKFSLINSFRKDNLILTSVSPWLSEQCSESEIFKKYENYVVFNGINLDSFARNKAKKIYSKNKNIVLFVSPSLTNENKGFIYFKKLAKLNDNNKKLKFIAITLENYIEDTPKNLTIINGVTNKKMLANYYNSAKVTVILSKRETYSMPLIESLCCGTPVIGFKAGGPETIGIKEYCKFVNYGDINSLNILLNQLVKEKIDKREIERTATRKYSLSMMVSSYINVYKKLDIDFNKATTEVTNTKQMLAN